MLYHSNIDAAVSGTASGEKKKKKRKKKKKKEKELSKPTTITIVIAHIAVKNLFQSFQNFH
jgi:hypothetical protein